MADIEAVFENRNLITRMMEHPLNTGAGWYRTEVDCKDGTVTKTIPQADYLLPEDVDGIRHYRVVTTYEEMVANGITRRPLVRLRTISANGHVSNRVRSIEAFNPPPEITVLPTCHAALNSAEVYITPPDAPDVVGYLASLSTVEIWTPTPEGAQEFESNAFNVNLGESNATHWVRFAAFDSFGKDDLIWTVAQPVSGINANFDDFEELADEMRDIADEVRAGGYAKATDLSAVARTIQTDQMLGVGERFDRIKATYMNGEPIGSVLEHNVEQTDDLIEITDVMVVWNEDKTALILNTDKVMVRDGVSMAEMETALRAETAAAKAELLEATTAVATDLAAEIVDRKTLSTAFDDNVAFVDGKLTLLSDATTALTEFQNIMSANGVQGGSIVIDTTKVKYSPTESIADRNALIESQFDGTASGPSKSFLLNTAQTAASDAQASSETLEQMGVELGNGSAWNLAANKVLVNVDGELLTSRLESIGATLDDKVNEINFQARVDTRVDVKVGPGSAIASQISSAQSTANGASSTASIALNAANGNTASIGIWTMVGGTATGIKVNGATQLIQLVAGQIAFVSSVGGAAVIPFQVIGNKVIATNFQADDIKARTITANMVIANNIDQTTRSLNDGGVGIGGSYVMLGSHAMSLSGGPADLWVSINVQNQGGGSTGVNYYMDIHRSGSLFLTTRRWGHYTFDGSNGAYNSTEFTTRFQPSGTGTYAFYVYGIRPSGGSTIVKDACTITVTDKKTQV